MTTSQTPTTEDLVRRAAELVPLLRKRANWMEENRRLADDVLDGLADAGVFKMRVPARYGGYESDVRTVSRVVAELARGDGSTAWTVAVWNISTWIAGLFPDATQDEIFSGPDVRVCGILSPTATAVPVDGGVIVNGKWAFNSGVQQSHWNTNAVILLKPGGEPEPIMTAIPIKELEIVDDWYTSGLRGSGSVSTVARDVFVPRERFLSMGPVLHEQYSSERNAATPIFRAPLLPTACSTVSGTAQGLAKAAIEAFHERLPGRKISYTGYAEQREAPLTHLQVAEATVKSDEAEFHAQRAATLVDVKSLNGESWTTEERARVRLDMGAACQRAKEAVEVLNTASGGSSIYSHVPIQRILRDVQALNLHGVMHPNTNYELYGRVLCGLEPNTHYL
ncbi:acyl-CoA dehydrogenase family protein [Micromonospora sp. PLK6-60]|uniref:acyl-CoA dehydrogenase family protein n=1 Tax=Micromonospora sp. PLK6-60 TaxID=2873383 RepID=UPI001CA62B4A|nr:acyl-CoA dehydrogenase family protein [Micromonospora sp. PLK6-60]MBY8870725.1 acyl-CoA dehydrogenase family protein [Micromonospora sp. PLK6-60]